MFDRKRKMKSTGWQQLWCARLDRRPSAVLEHCGIFPESGFPQTDTRAWPATSHHGQNAWATGVHLSTCGVGWRRGWQFPVHERHLTLKLEMPVFARTASSIVKLLSGSMSPAHRPTTETFLHLRIFETTLGHFCSQRGLGGNVNLVDTF